MSSGTQQLTVAFADTDHHQRTVYENLLLDQRDITLLRNVSSGNAVVGDYGFLDRRQKPRTNISVSENEVARIKRLRPLVLLVNMNLFSDDDQALLLSLHRECADALIILLADDFVHENRLLQALEIGVRGYLKNVATPSHLSKAIKVVGRGETWVPRKMLGDIMSCMLN